MTCQVGACQQLVFLADFGKIFQDIIDLAAVFSAYGIDQVQTVFHLQEAVAIKVQVLQDIRQTLADVLDDIVGFGQLLGDFLIVLIVFFHRLHVVHGRAKVGEAGEILVFQHRIGIGQGICNLLVVEQAVSLLQESCIFTCLQVCCLYLCNLVFQHLDSGLVLQLIFLLVQDLFAQGPIGFKNLLVASFQLLKIRLTKAIQKADMVAGPHQFFLVMLAMDVYQIGTNFLKNGQVDQLAIDTAD